MAYNIINVSFGGIRKITGPFISYRHDIKQILVIHDRSLPDYYEVDFCNDGDGQTITMVATPEGVQIPDELLVSGKAIKAYVVIPEDESVSTRREITLPVNNCPERSDIQPTPAEQQQIDSLIDALNDGVSRAEDAAELLENASAEAETLEPGSPATASLEDGVFRFGIPKGQRGETGPRGETGQRGEKGDTGETGQKGDKGDPFTYEDFTAEEKAELVQGPILDAQTAAVAAVGTARVNAVNDVNSAGSTQVSEVNTAGTEKLNAVNTAGTTQVAAVNSAGTTQVGNVNAAGATQVGLVQTEGAAQVQAVEDKGEEVLDSIPSDYTELAAQVQTLADTKAPVIYDTASGDIASFSDGADDMPTRELIATIEPVQDLHGQSNPYPAGGGVNELPITKSTTTVSGVTFTVNTDDGGNVVSITTSGTATADIVFQCSTGLSIAGAGKKLSGCPTGGSDSTYYMTARIGGAWSSVHDTGSGIALYSTIDIVAIVVSSGTNMNSKTFLPMIAASSVTTFAPYSNSCPITGHTGMIVTRTGKNLFPYETIPTYSYEWYSHGSSFSNASNPLFLKGGVTYVLSVTPNTAGSTNSVYIRMWDVNKAELLDRADILNAVQNGYQYTYYATPKYYYFTKAAISGSVVVTIQPTQDIWIDMIMHSGDGVGYNPQIVVGSSVSEREPYTVTTIPVTFPETIYGGSDEVIGGALESTMGMDDLGVRNWVAISLGGTQYFYISMPDILPRTTNVLMSCYSLNNNPNGAPTDKRFSVGWNYLGSKTICVRDDAYADVAAFKAAMVDQTLVYELETPIEYTLTPTELSTLYGTNNIWSDTGEVSVTYPADTKLYIDRKIAEALS
jgi:hypothetical protein